MQGSEAQRPAGVHKGAWQMPAGQRGLTQDIKKLMCAKTDRGIDGLLA